MITDQGVQLQEGDEKYFTWMRGDDFEGYANERLAVRDHETSALVPFHFRRGQHILNNVIEKCRAEHRAIRVLNLKARRYGGSTFVEGRFYFKTSLQDNKNTFIVAHEEEATRTLFRMAQLFHEQDPEPPNTIHNSSNEIRFDNPDGSGLKSEYRLATARNIHAGKSQGIHYLHISEEAMWEGDPDELLTSLFACIPKSDPDTEIFRESTAQGYGNTFQEDVFSVYEAGRYPFYQENGITYAWYNPESDWVVVFIPWFVVETYTKNFRDANERRIFKESIGQRVFDKDTMKWVESEEYRLMTKYSLTLEQLNWRRSCIENDCRGSEDLFHQNFPATVDEAFIKGGSNVFSKELCDHLESLCNEPLVVGDVTRKAGHTRVTPNKHGSFSLWEKVNKNDSYFITVDTAGGKKKQTASEKRSKQEADHTNIDVWNHRTGTQVAQWNGHVPYDFISDIVMMIGEMYQIRLSKRTELPVAAVELQNHGYTVVADLKREIYPQYEWKPGEPGWSTNRKTKPDMCDNLAAAVRDGEMKINSIGTVNEMRTFVEEFGEFSAVHGCKDDRVITSAIASKLMLLLPRKYGRERRGDRDRGAVEFRNWSMKNKDEKEKKKSYRPSKIREEYYVSR